MLAAAEKLCILFSLGAFSVEAALNLNGTDVGQPETCCGNAAGGTCADGSDGTPCCGKGKCNIFCCNCDGGCLAPANPKPPTPVPPSAMKTPLNQWPMITSHDAATCYFSSNTCTLTKTEANYVMTQVPGSFTEQLGCGARAFDLRGQVKDGKLIAHHGAVAIDKAMSDILNEIVDWAATNPTEFVLLYGSHCFGTDCDQKLGDAFASAKINLIQCSDVPSLTLGSAMKRGKLPTGGSVLAVQGCVAENYDASITCYGELGLRAMPTNGSNETQLSASKNDNLTASKGIYSCYGSDADKAFGPFWSYMNSKTDGSGKNAASFWMAQAHWQNDASSVVQGEVELSCILRDESKAGVNKKLAEKISQGSFPHINLLEVDDVCGGDGPDLLKSLRSRFKYDVAVEDETVVI